MPLFRAIYDLDSSGVYTHFPLEAKDEAQAKDKARGMLEDVGQYYELDDIDIIDISKDDWRIRK